MADIITQGTTIAISDGSSPETFLTIGEVVSIDGPGGNADVIDVSDLESDYREKRIGLLDEGQVTIEFKYDPDDTGQEAARAARNTREVSTFRITCPDSPATTFTFQAYVSGFPLNFAVSDVIRGTMTLEITGGVTRSA